MPVPGSPSVTSFYLLHRERGVVFNICLYLAFPVMFFYCLQGDKGVLIICLYLAFPMSCLSTDRKVRNGAVLTYVRTWLVFPVSYLPTCRKVNKGADLTYVRTCYFRCLPTYRKLKKGLVLPYACA